MTADLFEIAITAISLTGAALSVFALFDSSEDLHHIHQYSINGAVELTIKATLRREKLRLLIQVLLVTYGVVEMLHSTRFTPARGIILTAMTVLSVLHVLNTLFDRADLLKLRAMKLSAHTMQEALERIEAQGVASVTRDELVAHDLKSNEQMNRIEAQGDANVVRDVGVAEDLLESRDRADRVEKGIPGEAADAALRHAEGEKRRRPLKGWLDG